MARTTATAVGVIINTSLSDSEIEAFIDTANVMVTAYLENELTDTLLTEIEKYLAAHFITLKDPRLKSFKLDFVSEAVQGSTGLGFSSSHYGQTAMLLDSTGTLDKMNKEGKKKASISFIDFNTYTES